jgi:DivIVA domain-containing protein
MSWPGGAGSAAAARSRRPLTPHEIRTVRLRRLGPRKGYDPAEVDALLRRLAEEAAGRDRTIGDLAARLSRAEAELAQRRGVARDQTPLAGRLAEIERARTAQQYADELIEVAQHAAAQLVEQAKRQAAALLNDAHRVAAQTAQASRARPVAR